jgi:hypothetical protein
VSDSGFEIRRHLEAVVRVAVCVTVGVLLWRFAGHKGADYVAGQAQQNLVKLVKSSYGLDVEPDSIALLTPLPQSPLATLRGTDVAFLARDNDADPRDAYLLHVTLSPAGIPVDEGTLENLSKTADADETYLTVAPPLVAFAARSGGHVHNVQILDLRGEDPSLYQGWTGLERFEAHITNLQDTGRWNGFDHRIIDLLDSPEDVSLGWDASGDRLTITSIAGGGDAPSTQPAAAIVYDAGSRAVVQGKANAYAVEKGKNSLLGWAVDTARAVPMIGPDRIAWLEDRYYTLLDEIDRTRRTRLFVALHLNPKDPDVSADIGETIEVDTAPPIPGWPPAPLTPIASKPMKGEGEWQPQTADINPYYPQNANAPVPMYETFLRPDPENKPGAMVYALAIDPRQITMDMIAGTKDPAPSTGAVGPGEIPRDDYTLRHLVAAFEGGWQTVHADFGERTDGVDIAAPQPYGATIARMDDATVGIGTWGDTGGVEAVPKNMVSYRQNLTPLTTADKFNPYGRDWWGSAPNSAAPPGVAPTQFINRSAICLHKDGFLVYFWGREINASLLAKAVLQTGCIYTEMLDVNFGMAGFEFYRVHDKGVETPGAGNEADYSVVDKPLPERTDLVFDARELVHQMSWPRFPRYINRDQRDFLILLLRDILPGQNLQPPIQPALAAPFAEGAWQVGGVYQGKPEQVFPPTVAWTFVRPDPAHADVKVDLVKMDPRKLDVALSLGQKEPEAPEGLNDLAEGATDLVARVGIGLTDPSNPAGLATVDHVHFAPQKGWPTLAVYQTSEFSNEPRIVIGTWGAEIPAQEDNLLALVQSRPDGKHYQAPASDADAEHKHKKGAADGSDQVAAAMDPAGFVVLASSSAGSDAQLDAALRLAGCTGTIVHFDAGRSPGALTLTKDGSKGALLPDEAPLTTDGESELLFFDHARPYALQIFTDTAQVDSEAVNRAP